MKKIINFIKGKFFNKKTICVIEECLYHSEFRPVGFMTKENKAKAFCKNHEKEYYEYRYYTLKEIKK